MNVAVTFKKKAYMAKILYGHIDPMATFLNMHAKTQPTETFTSMSMPNVCHIQICTQNWAYMPSL